MVVTHDENLLNDMGIERIAEVARGTLEVFNCGYQKFLLERTARLDQVRKDTPFACKERASWLRSCLCLAACL
jgi:ATPase subunit of ABC transporter with duplicated ATPase domains